MPPRLLPDPPPVVMDGDVVCADCGEGFRGMENLNRHRGQVHAGSRARQRKVNEALSLLSIRDLEVVGQVVAVLIDQRSA